jgi:hypothetical protein
MTDLKYEDYFLTTLVQTRGTYSGMRTVGSTVKYTTLFPNIFSGTALGILDADTG